MILHHTPGKGLPHQLAGGARRGSETVCGFARWVRRACRSSGTRGGTLTECDDPRRNNRGTAADGTRCPADSERRTSPATAGPAPVTTSPPTRQPTSSSTTSTNAPTRPHHDPARSTDSASSAAAATRDDKRSTTQRTASADDDEQSRARTEKTRPANGECWPPTPPVFESGDPVRASSDTSARIYSASGWCGVEGARQSLCAPVSSVIRSDSGGMVLISTSNLLVLLISSRKATTRSPSCHEVGSERLASGAFRCDSGE